MQVSEGVEEIKVKVCCAHCCCLEPSAMAAVVRRAGAFAALLHALCMFILVSTTGASVGVNYGILGDNLPTPTQAIALMQKQGITQARIYDTNPSVLTAFQGSNIQIIVGVLNEEILVIGEDNATAYKWVKDHIVPFASTCNITCIAVGSEVLTAEPTLGALLVPAMEFLHTALVSFGLDSMIKVSSPQSTDLLTSTFPPSTGTFNSNFSMAIVQPMLDFLSQTGSFYMLNVYPHRAFQKNPQIITLDYALFHPNPGVIDSANGFVYTNAFDALLDATYTAMAGLNHTDLTIVVSETGWPSQGETTENGVSPSNAQTYNSNAVKHVLNKTGSPGRPGVVISTYVFELFNEDKKDGPASARNFGLFNADMTPVYAIDLSGSGVLLDNSPPVASANRTWCVAKQGVSEDNLQAALDYACGLGRADCVPIQSGQACFQPNTRSSHASYAMNSYYQNHANSPDSCDFLGTGVLTTTDPSYGTCVYTSSTPLAAQTASSTGSPSQQCCITNILLLSSALVFFLNLR